MPVKMNKALRSSKLYALVAVLVIYAAVETMSSTVAASSFTLLPARSTAKSSTPKQSGPSVRADDSFLSPQHCILSMPAVVCAAAVLAGVVGLGAPQPASASLMSEFGKMDYDEQSDAKKQARKKVTNKNEKYLAASRAAILDDALAKAKKKAVQKETEEAQKEKAAAALQKLEESMTKKATESKSENTPEFQKAEAVRQKVLSNLKQRKEEAKKAAVEAEAIAQRLEELANQARLTAKAAKEAAALGE